MSIQSEIERISSNVAAAYAAVEEMGGSVPAEQTSDNIAEAVRSIPLGKWSNPNLLINGYLADPINQRGQKSYDGARMYTIDRWINENGNGTVAILNTGVKFSWNRPDGASYAGFLQYIDTLGLIGKIATLSVVASGTGSCYLFTNDSPETRIKMDLAPEPRLYSLTAMLQPVTWSDWLVFRILADTDTPLAGDITLEAAKLELGPVQTLAHKEGDTWVLNDPPPNKALELAKCQRYLYNTMAGTSGRYVRIGYGFAEGNGSICNILTPTPVTMRVNPTAIFENLVLFSDDGTEHIVTGISWCSLSPGGIQISVSSPGLTPHKIYQLCTLETAGNLILDASL